MAATRKRPLAGALPALVAAAGEPAATRFAEFFAVTIRNPNTRAAYRQAVGEFLHWCETGRAAKLRLVKPFHVAAYIDELQKRVAPPTVKQHLAAIRMCFDWLVTGQAMPSNPARSVRGPRHSVTAGATPVLSPQEVRNLLNGIDVSTLVGLRDRAILAVML